VPVSLLRRHSRKLLTHFGIQADVLSCHEHNERARVPQIIRRLQQGEVRPLQQLCARPAKSPRL
jgi:16S rRNA C1402 (ribose-2'-O) methylase RsmI